MNGLRWVDVVERVRALQRLRDSPCFVHPGAPALAGQLGRVSLNLPGLGRVCNGKQLIELNDIRFPRALTSALEECRGSLLDPGLPGIWEYHLPELMDIAIQFLKPAMDFPVILWAHPICWTDQCIGRALLDTDEPITSIHPYRSFSRGETAQLKLAARDYSWDSQLAVRVAIG